MAPIRLAISDVVGQEVTVQGTPFGDWAVHKQYDGVDEQGKVKLKDKATGSYRTYWQVTHIPSGYLAKAWFGKRKDAYALAKALQPFAFQTKNIPPEMVQPIKDVLSQFRHLGA